MWEVGKHTFPHNSIKITIYLILIFCLIMIMKFEGCFKGILHVYMYVFSKLTPSSALVITNFTTLTKVKSEHVRQVLVTSCRSLTPCLAGENSIIIHIIMLSLIKASSFMEHNLLNLLYENKISNNYIFNILSIFNLKKMSHV